MIELSRVPAIRGLTPYDNMLRFLLSTDRYLERCADVIEGVPNAHINAGIVAAALERARRLYGGSPHLVPPRGRPLPRACCIARVRGRPHRDLDADHGEACLVWFQDEITATVAPDVADSLGGLVWSDIATDVRW